VLALVYPHHLGFILAEVKTLSGMNLTTHCLMKVVKAYHPITVLVKHLKDNVELLIR
jgi:hypothetical protein